MPEIKWKELPVNEQGEIEFPVPKSKWLRGSGLGRLLSEETGTYCCLGLAGLAMGVPDSAQLDRGLPSNLIDSLHCDGWHVGQQYDKFNHAPSVVADIVEVNDTVGISDKERIRRLTALFAKIGFRPIFIDDEEQH